MNTLSAKQLVVQKADWHGTYSFSINQGEWLSIIGPSGGGKSSLLEAIAGFVPIKSGELNYNSFSLLNTPIAQRSIGFVFQQNALFPHLSIAKNLLLALHDNKESFLQKQNKIKDVLQLVKISPEFLSRYPSEVSGGELARLNIARTLLRDIKILLLDEPFAALDESLRLEMNLLMHRIHTEKNLTTLCVTHFQEDAFLFSDSLLFVINGVTNTQQNTFEALKNPATPEIANFINIGTPYTTSTGEQLFIRPHNLSTLCLPHFIKPIHIHLTNYRLLHMPTHNVVICLTSGKTYRFDKQLEFKGDFYFDLNNIV